MRKILREEMDRALHSPRILLAILMALGFFFYGYTLILDRGWVPAGYSYADLWFFVYVGSNFPFILPLVAVLPYADSFAVDQSEGFLRYLVVRTNYRKYIASKFLVNLIVTALAILIPLICLYIFANIAAPRSLVPINHWSPQISGRPEGFMRPFFEANPDGFILCVSLLAVFTGAAYSTLGIAISLIYSNRYLVWAAPCAIFLMAHFVASKTHFFGMDWSPISAVYGNISAGQHSPAAFFLNPLAVFCLAALILPVFGQRKRVLR